MKRKQVFRGITYLREVAESMDAVIKLPGGAYNYGSETTKNMYEVTEEFIVNGETPTRFMGRGNYKSVVVVGPIPVHDKASGGIAGVASG